MNSQAEALQAFYQAGVTNLVRTGVQIKVIGIGGSGGNAIDHMIDSGVAGVDFIAVNTDAQDLHENKAEKKIHIGRHLTQGRGAGMNPEIGRRVAEETKNELEEALKGVDMVFITCGLGGGTGSGAAPVIAKIARDNGALTLAVVTVPFAFEGVQRAIIAHDCLEDLTRVVDTLIVIPNDRVLGISNQKTLLSSAFALCDDVLKNAVQGISELIVKPGIINLDFADIKAVTAHAGLAIMGIGQAHGDERAVKAAQAAISSPLLNISIDGAKGILFAIAGGEDLTLSEIHEAAKIITASADPKAKIIFGALRDMSLNKGEIKITVIATGVQSKNLSPPFEIKEEENYYPIKKEDQEMKKKISTPIINDIKPQPISNVFLESYQDKQQSFRAHTSWDFFDSSEEAPTNAFMYRIKKIGEIFLILLTLLAGAVALGIYGIYKAASILVLKIKLKRRFAGRTF